jgi:hypothetical protein
MLPGADPRSALRIEACRDADVARLMTFIGSQWRAGHIFSRDEALLRWQFAPERLRGRSSPGPTVLLAWLNGEIVGMLGVAGFDLSLLGTRYSGVWLSHWFASPAHRSSNVAMRLIWAARELGVDAFATLGANEVSTKLLACLGLQVIPDLPRWVGVFDADSAADLLCAANPGLLREDAVRQCRNHLVVAPASDRRGDDYRSVPWDAAVAGAWDRFWADRLAPRLVAATRDAAYLQWRYVAHPRFTYHVRFARRERDDAVEGLVVFRVEQVRDRPWRVIRIVDFLASEEGEACLVAAVREAARASGAVLGDFYCSSAPAAGALGRAGFRLQPAGGDGAAFPSRLQPLQPGHFRMSALARLPGEWRGALLGLADDGRLYLTKSDGDQDRPN